MEKTLLVIGASSDMALRLIEESAGEYAHILAHYRRESEGLDRLKAALGDKLELLQADLSHEAEVLALIDAVKALGRMPEHMVFFAANAVTNTHFHKTPVAAFDTALSISLRAAILICQAFLPAMAKQKHGRVVMMLSSVLSGPPLPYSSGYVVEKYALWGLMRALASEYAAKGITVNGVSPTWTDTKFITQLPELVTAKHVSEMPVKRMLRVDEVTPAIRFLLSDAAGAVSGQNLFVSFGR